MLMIAIVTKVKSGGHAANANFSSTPGVQIAMYSFSDVVYDSATQTATVGTGLLWDDVYAALEQYSVTVVGAKVTGIGVGGIALGGGMVLPRPMTELSSFCLFTRIFVFD
jgi:FAD/FMN-containing dehydrogenase